MLRAVTLAMLTLPASAVFAEGQSIALKVGALGVGAEYTHELTERLALRGGLYGSEWGFGVTESGIRYDADVVWDSVVAGVDFHPMKSPLRLSAGLMKNNNRLELTSRPTGNVTIGDTTYTPDEAGTLLGRVGADDTATVLSVGWDWSRDSRLFGMSLDLGLVEQGDPVVTLRGTGALFGDPAFEQDIDAEISQIEDELDYGAVPFLSLGFQFRF